jgi:hypothetical protein
MSPQSASGPALKKSKRLIKISGLMSEGLKKRRVSIDPKKL